MITLLIGFCSGSCRWSRGSSRSHKYKTTNFLGSLNAVWKFFEIFLWAGFQCRNDIAHSYMEASPAAEKKSKNSGKAAL
jgi:hypothetical protein